MMRDPISPPRYRARTLVSIVVLCACVAFAMRTQAMMIPALQAPVAPIPVLTGTLPVGAPLTASVGDAVLVTVGPVATPDNVRVTLLMVGSYGPRVYQTAFARGMATFTLPPRDTQQSGLVTLVAHSGAAYGQAGMTLLPRAPVGPVTPLVGARTIPVGGVQWSMTTAIPVDMYGNPVAAGTDVRVRVQHPGGNRDDHDVPTAHGVAWVRIYSGTIAGRTTITVQAGDAGGPEGTLLEAPGAPEPYTLSASPTDLPADGRQLLTLRTSVLKDRYGNTLPDGTLVTFLMNAPDGARRIPAYTVGGTAEVTTPAIRQAAVIMVKAVVLDIESPPIEVAFTEGLAVNPFELVARADPAQGAVILTTSPLFGALGQYVPEGTTVLFRVTDPRGETRWFTGTTSNGRSIVELSLGTMLAGTYTAEALVGAGRASTTFEVPSR